MSSLASLLGHLTWIVALGCGVVYAAIIAIVVRRHRPDAWTGLFAWALFTLGSSAFSTALWRVYVPNAVEHGDYVSSMAAVNLLDTVFQVVTTILFVRGIVMLAQPPKPLVVENQAPYR